jgi:aromatic ring-cleaving dioxygenase
MNPMRTWSEPESVPPRWEITVDDERIVEFSARHKGRTENVLRWDEISAWSRGWVAKWFPDAIVFLTTATPLYETAFDPRAPGSDVLLDALEQRRVPRISLEALREQVAWRQRVKVDEVLERRFTPAERAAVRAAFASNPEFASPYVQLATLNLAGSDVERIRRTAKGPIDDWTEFLHAADQQGWGGLSA